MALPDLTGLNIEDTYQRVLHTDGTYIWDGTGSLVVLQYTGSFTGDGSGLTGITAVAVPAGNNFEIQFNSGSALKATGSFTFNYLSESLQQGEAVTASGIFSHAEGYYTIAQGNYSHAEGLASLAEFDYSHAEGIQTSASNNGAHSEGYFTKALGIASHAEGTETIALGDYSHVQGQYNISSSVPSAFIIGNGVDANNRSNLVFAAGTEFQITGSLLVSGSIDGIINGGTF